MKKLKIIAATLATAITFAPTAFAKKGESVKFDMKNAKCEEVIKLDEDSAAVILMWLDGYLSGITGDTMFDGKQLEKFATSLGEYCAKNPKAKLLDASKKVGTTEDNEE